MAFRKKHHLKTFKTSKVEATQQAMQIFHQGFFGLKLKPRLWTRRKDFIDTHCFPALGPDMLHHGDVRSLLAFGVRIYLQSCKSCKMDHVNYVIRNQCRTSAYGPVVFQEPEHHRNIALATKAMQEWTVLALIACLSPSSLSSSCNPTRLRGAFSQRSGLLDTSWSSAGNGNCITLRKALDLCVLAMTRVSHAVLLYSISPYAVIGKIYDSCAKEHTKHAKKHSTP